VHNTSHYQRGQGTILEYGDEDHDYKDNRLLQIQLLYQQQVASEQIPGEEITANHETEIQLLKVRRRVDGILVA
jgi:hypothetical protein